MNRLLLERKRKLEKELERILEILISEYQPNKIILFGSLAKETLKEWSDIDLFLIKETPKRYLDRIDEVMHLVHPKVGIDLFVLTPEEIRKALDEEDPYIQEILTEGKVLYEKTG
jgi:predicted nucleotidyltransferase